MSLLVADFSAFLLLLTVAWSLYSEFFGLRPWRDYQNRFRTAVLQLSAASRSASAAPPSRPFTPLPTTRS